MPTNVSERRHDPSVGAYYNARTSSSKTGAYFGVVSWLSALGVVIAVALTATYPAATDIMWLFSQVP